MNEILALPRYCEKQNPRLVYLGFRTKTKEEKENKEEEKEPILKNKSKSKYEPTMVTMSAKVAVRGNENIIEDESLCYCFNCKKAINSNVIENIIEEPVYWSKSRIQEYTTKIYECPICKTRSNQNDIFKLKETYLKYRKYYLDDNKLKISEETTIFNWYNNHLIIDNTQYRKTLNLDTGYTYSFSPKKNGKIKNPGIKNITYNVDNTTYYAVPYSNKCDNNKAFYNEIYNIIREYNMKKLNIYIPTYKENYNRKPSSYYRNVNATLSDVILFNRFPTMSINYAIDNFNRVATNKEFIKLRRSIKHNSLNPIKDILSFYNIPVTKTNKSKLNSNINYPIFFNKLNKIINNYDNVNKILKPQILRSLNFYEINVICKSLSILMDEKGFNINSFCNKVFDNNNGILYDTMDLVDIIKVRKPDYKFNFKCSLKDFHDTLSIDFNKLKHENVVIKYDEFENKLEGQYDELTFNLAKDTHELIEVGTDMHICVGSYRESALCKNLDIIIARNSENEPIICIELDSDCLKIRQSKLKYNDLIKNNTAEYEAIKKWIHANRLSVERYCNDMPDDLKAEVNNLYQNEKRANSKKVSQVQMAAPMRVPIEDIRQAL